LTNVLSRQKDGEGGSPTPPTGHTVRPETTIPLVVLLVGGLGAGVLGAAALAQVPPAGSPLPRVLPPDLPSVAPATAPPPEQPGKPLPAATVAVTSVAVEGATAYDRATLAGQTKDLTGPAVPLARIEAARSGLLQRYRADGYVLSAVSVSIDANGALRFLVTEGRIAAVKLSNDIGPAGTRVLRFLQRLTEKTPIDEATLERYLLLAQDVPGITLHAVLQPVAGEPGAVTLIAEVSRAPFSGLITTDNYASRYTGPVESLLVLDGNSFTALGERTEISLYHTWPNSQTFGQASSEVFIGDDGLKLRVYGGSGQTSPTGPLALEGYLGITNVFGAVLTYPLLRSRTETLNVFGDLDAIESEVSVLANDSRGRASFDSLRVARTGADYARSDLWLGGDRGAVSAVSVRLSKGLRAFGASTDDADQLPRTGEATDFFKAEARLSRTQTLFSPYQGATVALAGVVAGQVTSDTLPPAEEFYLGGLQYLRGYESGEITGDRALTTTVELQFNTSLDLGRLSLTEPVPLQVYGFYDWGEVWQHDPASLKVRAASTGIGVRVTATRYAELDFLGAARLNRYPTGSGGGIKALGPGAFLWRVLSRF
jgi:hemolysin activation/secretion protein